MPEVLRTVCLIPKGNPCRMEEGGGIWAAPPSPVCDLGPVAPASARVLVRNAESQAPAQTCQSGRVFPNAGVTVGMGGSHTLPLSAGR